MDDFVGLLHLFRLITLDRFHGCRLITSDRFHGCRLITSDRFHGCRLITSDRFHGCRLFVCLFDLILYVHSTIFQLCGTVFLG